MIIQRKLIHCFVTPESNSAEAHLIGNNVAASFLDFHVAGKFLN